jgi:hypothetical protein
MDTLNEILRWIGGMTCVYFFVELLKFIARQFNLHKKYRIFYHKTTERQK